MKVNHPDQTVTCSDKTNMSGYSAGSLSTMSSVKSPTNSLSPSYAESLSQTYFVGGYSQNQTTRT